MNKDDMIRRGQAAASLLDSGVFLEAMKAVEAECAEAWKASRPNDNEGRENLYRMVQCYADLGRILQVWKGEATKELHELERQRREPSVA